MIAPAAKPPALLLTAREAAEALAMSERTLARQTYPHGDLPALRIGTGEKKIVRYRIDDLIAWINRHVQGAEHESNADVKRWIDRYVHGPSHENGTGEQLEHDVAECSNHPTPKGQTK